MALDGREDYLRLAALRRYDILDTPAEPVFDRLAELAAGFLAMPVTVIAFVDADRVWVKAAHGADAVQLGDAVMRVADVVTQDCPRLIAVPDPAGAAGLRVAVAAPLLTPEGHAIGVIAGMERRSVRLTAALCEKFTLAAGVVMDQLEARRHAGEAAQLQAALSEACPGLERPARPDPLTGLACRTALIAQAGRLIIRARSGITGAAMILLEIDGLEALAAGRGEAAGEAVIRNVAQQLARSCRAHDVLGRLDGGVFLAVFSEVTRHQALAIARRLRESVSAARIPLAAEEESSVTVSAGVLMVPPADLGPFCFEAALAEVRHALRIAKAEGGDRAVVTFAG